MRARSGPTAATSPQWLPQAEADLYRDFRGAMRKMATTVTIVSTQSDGVRYGMTANAVTSVSMSPPSLLVCVNQSASIHAPLLRIGRFCISILASGQDDHCYTFSGRKEGEERFLSGCWGSLEGIPFLQNAQANLFCSIERQIGYGTHTVFIARVTRVHIEDNISPLVYVNGGLTNIAGSSEQNTGRS